MERQLARRLNRPELGPNVSVIAGSRPGGNVAGLPEPGRGNTAAIGASGRLELSTGTISVGMLAAIVVGLGLFYVWTRGGQA